MRTLTISGLLLATLTLPGWTWPQTPSELSAREVSEAAEKKNPREPVTLSVHREGGNKSSPHLWGIMFEVGVS